MRYVTNLKESVLQTAACRECWVGSKKSFQSSLLALKFKSEETQALEVMTPQGEPMKRGVTQSPWG